MLGGSKSSPGKQMELIHLETLSLRIASSEPKMILLMYRTEELEIVYWNDSNGSTFVLSSIGGFDHPLVVEDCTVVYARATWHHWAGGRLFNMRGEGGGEGGPDLVFRNIVVEDQRPTLQHFMIAMQGVEPWSDPDRNRRKSGDLHGILFQNITIAAAG